MSSKLDSFLLFFISEFISFTSSSVLSLLLELFKLSANIEKKKFHNNLSLKNKLTILSVFLIET